MDAGRDLDVQRRPLRAGLPVADITESPVKVVAEIGSPSSRRTSGGPSDGSGRLALWVVAGLIVALVAAGLVLLQRGDPGSQASRDADSSGSVPLDSAAAERIEDLETGGDPVDAGAPAPSAVESSDATEAPAGSDSDSDSARDTAGGDRADPDGADGAGAGDDSSAEAATAADDRGPASVGSAADADTAPSRSRDDAASSAPSDAEPETPSSADDDAIEVGRVRVVNGVSVLADLALWHQGIAAPRRVQLGDDARCWFARFGTEAVQFVACGPVGGSAESEFLYDLVSVVFEDTGGGSIARPLRDEVTIDSVLPNGLTLVGPEGIAPPDS